MTENTVVYDASVTILGAILVDPKCLPENLKPEDFEDIRHRTIFEAMVSLSDKGEEIGLLGLRKALGASIERAGGVAYLASLIDGVPRLESVKSWVKIVKEAAAMRLLADNLTKVNRLVSEGADPASILSVMDYAVSEVRDRINAHEGPRKLSDFTKPLLVSIEDESEGKPTGAVMTGFRDLDDMLGGFQPGDLVTLAAGTGIGKSSFAANVARQCGKPTMIVSLEMTGKSIAKRLLFAEAGINAKRVRDGLEEAEWSRLGSSFGALNDIPIWIDDTARTPSVVRSRAKKFKDKHGVGFLIIDYLQLMHIEGASENRAREVGQISGAMKMLAMELDIPVMVLSQFSRAPKDRKDKRPVLSDLKESGQIENDSDLCLLLYREDGKVTDLVRRTEVIVAKNRSGPDGMIYLDFDRETTTFQTVLQKETE